MREGPALWGVAGVIVGAVLVNVAQAGRAEGGIETHSLLRTRGLEIVDAEGTSRAVIGVDPAGSVSIRLGKAGQSLKDDSPGLAQLSVASN